MTRETRTYLEWARALALVALLAALLTSCAIVNGSAYRVKPLEPLRPCLGTHTADSIQICRDTTAGGGR